MQLLFVVPIPTFWISNAVFIKRALLRYGDHVVLREPRVIALPTTCTNGHLFSFAVPGMYGPLADEKDNKLFYFI